MAVELSGRITTQIVISGEPSAARTTAGPKGGRRSPSARPPPTAALLMRKVRRVNFGMAVMVVSSRGLGGGVDRFAHLLEGAAAADVGDGGIDVGVARLGIRLEERSPRRDHARLSMAALRHDPFPPRLLTLVQCLASGKTLHKA